MSMTAAQIAQAYDGKKSGDGWLIRCPSLSHHDKKSSCSIKDGNKQPIVATCYAGCEWKDIEQGLIHAGYLDEKPALTGYASNPNHFKSTTKNTTKTAITTVNPPKGIFPTNGSGDDNKNIVEWYKYNEGYVARYEGKVDPDTGKKTKSFGFYFNKSSDGSVKVGIPKDLKKRSLFNSAMLNKAKEIWFVEGERKVNALGNFGIVATTTSGGAASFDKTDLSPLAGKRIIFWRDNDKAGFKYQEKCCDIFEGMGCDVVIINPDDLDLKEKEDVCDFLKKNPKTTKKDLLKLTWEKPVELSAVPDIDEDLIPEDAGIRKFVKSISLAYNCEKIAPANILILSICGLIGSRAGLKIWQEQNWISFPNTFGGIVAPPSFGKSPIMNAALDPLTELNKKIAKERAEEAIAKIADMEIIDIQIAEVMAKIKEEEKGKLK